MASSDEMDSDNVISQKDDQIVDQLRSSLPEAKIKEDKLARQTRQCKKGSTLAKDKDDNSSMSTGLRRSSRKRAMASESPKSGSGSKHRKNCACHLCRKVTTAQPQAKRRKTTQVDEKTATVIESITTLQQLLSEDNPSVQISGSPNLKISKKASTSSVRDTFPASSSPFETAGPSTSQNAFANVPTQSSKQTVLKSRKSSDQNVGQLVAEIPNLTEMDSDEEEIQQIKQLPPQLTEKEIKEDKLAHQMLQITMGSTLTEDDEDDIPAKSTGQSSSRKRITKSNFPESSSCNKPKHPINCSCHLCQKVSKNAPQLPKDNSHAQTPKSPYLTPSKIAAILAVRKFFSATESLFEAACLLTSQKASVNVPTQGGKPTVRKSRKSSGHNVMQLVSATPDSDEEEIQPIKQFPSQLTEKEIEEDKLAHQMLLITKGSTLTEDEEDDILGKSTGQSSSKKRAIECNSSSESKSCNKPKRTINCSCHLRQKVSKNKPQLSEDNPRAQTSESPNLKISKKAATLSDGDTFPAFLSPFEAAGPSTSAEVSVNVPTQSGKPTELKSCQSSDQSVGQHVSATSNLTEMDSDEEEIQQIKQLPPQLTEKEIEDDKLAHQMLLITKNSTLTEDDEDDILGKSTSQSSSRKRITKSNF